MKSRYIRKKLLNNKTRDLHRIIMEEHLGRKLTRHEIVHHIDGDGYNNDLSNLQLMSLSEHTRLHYKPIPFHGMLTGNAGKKGSANATARLTEEDVKKIKLLINKKISLKSIALAFEVGKTTIADIKDGRSWKHI